MAPPMPSQPLHDDGGSSKKEALKLAQLASHDDLITDALVDRVYFWTTIRKNRERYFASRGLHEESVARIIQQHVIIEKDPTKACAELLKLPGLQRYHERLPSSDEREHFERHLRKYVNMYLSDCPWEVSTTNRYTIDTQEAAAVARRYIKKGEVIKYLCGIQVSMTKEDEKKLDITRTDFSIVLSSRKKTPSLFMGPARFANHDCDPNARLTTRGPNGMMVVAAKDIAVGHEITVSYGDDYFGRDNRECLCATCEVLLRNGWSPDAQSDSDSEPDEDAADETDVSDLEGSRKRKTKSARRSRTQSPPWKFDNLSTIVEKQKAKALRGSMHPHSPQRSQLDRVRGLQESQRSPSRTRSAQSTERSRPQSSLASPRVRVSHTFARSTSPSSQDAPDMSRSSSRSTPPTSVSENAAEPEKINTLRRSTRSAKGMISDSLNLSRTQTSPNENDFSESALDASGESRYHHSLRTLNNRAILDRPDATATDPENPLDSSIRRPGDYTLTPLLLVGPHYRWNTCRTCSADFVQADAYQTRWACPRCERHSKLYGYQWPKTEKRGKDDLEERVLDHRTVNRFVFPDEEREIKKGSKTALKQLVLERLERRLRGGNSIDESDLGLDTETVAPRNKAPLSKKRKRVFKADHSGTTRGLVKRRRLAEASRSKIRPGKLKRVQEVSQAVKLRGGATAFPAAQRSTGKRKRDEDSDNDESPRPAKRKYVRSGKYVGCHQRKLERHLQATSGNRRGAFISSTTSSGNDKRLGTGARVAPGHQRNAYSKKPTHPGDDESTSRIWNNSKHNWLAGGVSYAAAPVKPSVGRAGKTTSTNPAVRHAPNKLKGSSAYGRPAPSKTGRVKKQKRKYVLSGKYSKLKRRMSGRGVISSKDGGWTEDPFPIKRISAGWNRPRRTLSKGKESRLFISAAHTARSFGDNEHGFSPSLLDKNATRPGRLSMPAKKLSVADLLASPSVERAEKPEDDEVVVEAAAQLTQPPVHPEKKPPPRRKETRRGWKGWVEVDEHGHPIES